MYRANREMMEELLAQSDINHEASNKSAVGGTATTAEGIGHK